MENQRVRLSLEEYKKLLELRGDSYNGQQPNHLGKYRVTIPMEEYIQIQKAFGKIEDAEEVEIPKANSKVISDIISRYTEEELKQIAKGRGLAQTPTYDKPVTNKVGKHRIGVMTDTHIGSKYTNSEYIIDSLKMMKDKGCEMIIHAGDIVEGISHRQGHVFECTHYGFDAQFEETKRILSTTDLPIYAIAGNHQAWAMNAVGADINRYLERDLEHFHYLGYDNATMNIGSVKALIWHGNDGNSSYATSYRVQKIIESMQGGTKPNILITGHTHKMVYLFERNIHALSAGCMQFQTAFMMGKKLAAHVGFFIVDIEESNGEVLSFCPTFYPKYK